MVERLRARRDVLLRWRVVGEAGSNDSSRALEGGSLSCPCRDIDIAGRTCRGTNAGSGAGGMAIRAHVQNGYVHLWSRRE
jgi:hypothetical protein